MDYSLLVGIHYLNYPSTQCVVGMKDINFFALPCCSHVKYFPLFQSPVSPETSSAQAGSGTESTEEFQPESVTPFYRRDDGGMTYYRSPASLLCSLFVCDNICHRLPPK